MTARIIDSFFVFFKGKTLSKELNLRACQSVIVLISLVFFFLSLSVLTSCAGVHSKAPQATKSNFLAPKIELSSFEVPQYDGWWYFSRNVKPTKGTAGNRGAPLPLSFLFKITNPNSYPICLESYHFTVSFESFELVTFNCDDSYYIPPGKSDMIRATTLITVRSALLNLLVTGGYALKAKGWSSWEALERWWRGVPERKVAMTLTKGAFTFSADDMLVVYPFSVRIQ